MVMEGSYALKRPCYNTLLVNPDDVKCLHGAPWHAEYTQRIMGGDLPGKNTTIKNNDNFH